MAFSSFHSWSVDHIKSCFEARSEEECIKAVDDSFSEDLFTIINGKDVTRAQLQHFVLTMAKTSGFNLHVDWQSAVEVPYDPLNKDGVLGGYYIIRNVKKPGPDGTFVPCERHKFVNVVIEQRPSDASAKGTTDVRRITKLYLTAEDRPVLQSPN